MVLFILIEIFIVVVGDSHLFEFGVDYDFCLEHGSEEEICGFGEFGPF